MDPATLSVDELVCLGKTSYSRKRFDVALDYFRAALLKSSSPSMDILDHLAAVCDKTGRIEESLQYGKQMIQLDDTNSRGYLRIGRSLENSGKPSYLSKQVAIYERGVKKVKPLDPNFKYLQHLRDSVSRKACPPNAIDPFSVLPVELAHMILDYVEFLDLVTCLRVSKQWHSFLTSQPNLWSTMDLSKKPQRYKKISPQFVKFCIKYSQYSLRSAYMGSFDHVETIVAMLRCCKELNTLSIGAQSGIGGSSMAKLLPYCNRIRNLTIGSLISNSQIHDILSKLPPLEELRFLGLDPGPTIAGRNTDVIFPQVPCYPNLRIFELAGQCNTHTISAENFEANFLRLVSNLDTLILQAVRFNASVNFSTCSKLKRLKLSESNFGDGFTLPPSILDLHLHKIHGSLSGQVLPELQELQYTNCLQGPDYLEALLSTGKPSDSSEPFVDPPNFSGLKTLRICGSRWSTYANYHRIIRTVNDFRDVFSHPRLYGLETLSVQNAEIHDDALEIIAEHFTALKSVRFADVGITGYGIKTLILAQPKLEWLVLENCNGVSSDAITWAQSQGVRVTKLYQAISDSGRKIADIF